MPRIEIALSQIQDNARMLSELYGQKGISLMGVSKAALGDPQVARAMIQGGVDLIADSRLENIQRMKKAGISIPFVLLRTAPSQAESVVRTVDISLNTEFETIQELSRFAKKQKKTHKIILMVELGDLREGVLPSELPLLVKSILDLPNIEITGIGTNLACYGGIKPEKQNMERLSEIANSVEKDFQLQLEIISGGNSANHEWVQSAQNVGRINNLRLGESLLLGRETIGRNPIPGLHTEAFKLVAEVIESKEKPSLPFGEISQNAFGDVPTFVDRGIRRRVIVALGRQDVLISGLKPISSDLEILGASSDHLILHSRNHTLRIGSEVEFHLDYGALLSAMTSPFIEKVFLNS
ncbi:MAG: alanine/ornithine racemase family PLP-dependent enzyme [Anaerolineae bacterium]|nr:alanine/ornithine racemase family PLP-dependent enzyme [Anaerolineae bacterium]